MLQLKALDHVGLVVNDLDKSLNFYERLGLKVLRTKGPDANGVRTAVIQVGNQELNVFSQSKQMPAGNVNAVGIDHFCFEVEATSINDVIADLKHAGIEIARGPTERRDGTALFVHDPDGVRVELQIKKRSTPATHLDERQETSGGDAA